MFSRWWLCVVAVLTAKIASVPVVTPQLAVPGGTMSRCLACASREQLEVEVSPFHIDIDEVSQAQYAECVHAKQCSAPQMKTNAQSLHEPVRAVSWHDADRYCRFVHRRLPTVTEWEFVAFPKLANNFNREGPRIGTQKPCQALVIGGYDGKACHGKPLPAPVDVTVDELQIQQPDSVLLDRVELSAGKFVFDLYGNVAEWVADWDAYPSDPEYYFKPLTRKNPKGPAHGDAKLIVGGSYAAWRGSRQSEHRRAAPDARLKDVGFRCASD